MEYVASSVNESGDEADEADERKITLMVSEALESLDGVKNKMNMMLNDLIGSVEKLKLKTLRQTNITSFLKKWNCKDMIQRTLLQEKCVKVYKKTGLKRLTLW